MPGRRQVLGLGGSLAAAGALGLRPARATAAQRTRTSVAVLGGGVGGLTAAHELAERGFDVTVYDRRAEWGGKARSFPVPGTATGGRRDLQGEHGHRGFFGFYTNLPDTMRRVPFGDRAHGVWDNLTTVPYLAFNRNDGKGSLFLPTLPPSPRTLDPGTLPAVLEGLLRIMPQLLPQEVVLLARKLAILMTSCDERQFGQWEHTQWLEFIEAAGKSEFYRVMWGGSAKVIQALRPETASARTCGQGISKILYALLGMGPDGPFDRILDGPTSERFIDPWVRHLKSLGVRFVTGHHVESLELGPDGRIAAAHARTAAGPARIDADWFVAALPLDRVRQLWSAEIRAADPRLAAMDRLRTTWCQGIVFYLKETFRGPLAHLSLMDSPWALCPVGQSRFWSDPFTGTWGDGVAADSLSVVISDWETPGMLYGRPARRCTPKEIAEEVWAQLKAGLEGDGDVVLPDGSVHSWFLDPAVTRAADGQLANDDTYFLNDVSSWELRAEAVTAVPNLFLAGDHVRTYSNVDFTCMETANEAGRRAANGVLAAAGADGADEVRLFAGAEPPGFAALKAVDRTRYQLGLPHTLDF
ncbi:FAD-dependent oxidoreductase [Streptomyces antnestii]|uniref:FAD-dependent oxidoreductase n=1 Tax=Streptomyces antnestii TaxID=2494256 RepID=A0A437PKW8_9ACTN|nr:FAD-dependent oxidoreductase [Streptomyces sp. San01]